MAVGVPVKVRQGVAVTVGVGVGVLEGVAVKLLVGGGTEGVLVAVKVLVGVRVLVAVLVVEGVGVRVAVFVAVGLGVLVGVRVGVLVAVRVAVFVGVGVLVRVGVAACAGSPTERKTPEKRKVDENTKTFIGVLFMPYGRPGPDLIQILIKGTSKNSSLGLARTFRTA